MQTVVGHEEQWFSLQFFAKQPRDYCEDSSQLSGITDAEHIRQPSCVLLRDASKFVSIFNSVPEDAYYYSHTTH